MKKISFFIPFKNEQDNIKKTIDVIAIVANDILKEYEIILVNDHSNDQSIYIIQSISNLNISLHSLNTDSGFGAAYIYGYRQCRFEFCMYLSGDGDVEEAELRNILTEWDGQSILVQFCQNLNERHFYRYCLSKFYTFLVSLISGISVPYFNGFNIIPKNQNLLKNDSNFGFSTQAFNLIKNIKMSKSQPQILGTYCRFDDKNSKALTFKNVYQTLQFFFHLIYEF